MKSFAVMLIWLVGWAGISLGQALTMPPTPALAVASPTNRTVTVLRWTPPKDAVGYVVYRGPVRNAWTNRVVIKTNIVVIEDGTVYGVSFLTAKGAESAPAYWPSNRLAAYWLRGMGTNATQPGTNIAKLLTFTNTPPGQMRIWGIADVTEGWLPPK